MPNIEDLIQRAIQEGKFSDLPGKGKPLRLDDNPHADPDWQLAYHLLERKRLFAALARAAPGDRKRNRSRPPVT